MDFTILVNKNTLLKEDYVPENLVEINEPTGEKIDKSYINRLNKTAYEFFKIMQKEALKQGYEIFIDSSYRTYEYQKLVFEKNVEEHGIEHAKKYVAPPGGSEHQTGLAFDVIARRNGIMIEKSSDEDPELIWMKENAYKFGYILRYPKDKEKITGFNYERWHYRFVGPEISIYMKENNIETLEEYHLLTNKKHQKK
ncbi:MAG: M15 family metallopeptidase [Bacilli bacterium]|nr:M15 family metallopeptidase [Bacilli bacterium]